MAQPLRIERNSLRDQIRNVIRKRIIDGQIPAEAKLVEVDLAQELGVSRTPLREALIALEQEGFLTTSPGRGFSVQPLSGREYEELVTIIGTLERLALTQSDAPTPQQIAQLRRLNEDIRSAYAIDDSDDRVHTLQQTDLLFHDVLLERCRNRKLLDLLHSLKQQWRRYEFAYWSLVRHEQRSAEEHDRIMDALDRADLAVAADCLEANWRCWVHFDEAMRIREVTQPPSNRPEARHV